MTTVRKLVPQDLFRFNNVNLDVLTETYNNSFYLHYFSKWPIYYELAESPNKSVMGYVMGKVEGKGELWHGHVTAVTVAPEYRRMGLATLLMNSLEQISEKIFNGYFVDLFVRKSNAVAIGMYEKLGYIVHREVINYYSGEENAYDMRKALPRDVEKKSMVRLEHPVLPEDVD